MGTNYYVKKTDEHIGKRSAAGWYCWHCGQTLCVDGEDAVHYDESEWHECCPTCGAGRKEEPLSQSAAGKELGFNTRPHDRPKGVASCSSFTWAMKPNVFSRITGMEHGEKMVVDEYGREFDLAEFSFILSDCPIWLFDMVGKEFS